MRKDIYVEIYLDEFTNSELIEELEQRPLGYGDQRRILKLLKSEDSDKLKIFYENKEKFSVTELQEILAESFITNISDNQLSFVFKD